MIEQDFTCSTSQIVYFISKYLDQCHLSYALEVQNQEGKDSPALTA